MLSRVGLSNLMQWLQNDNVYPTAYQVNYPEFIQKIDGIKKVIHQKEQQAQIIMFTVSVADEETVTLEQKTETMELLRKSIALCLDGDDITTRFSSSQQIVILTDTDGKNAENIANQIMSNFYKMNQYKNFSIHYETGKL